MSVLMVEDTSCSACDVDCVTDKYRLANPPRGATFTDVDVRRFGGMEVLWRCFLLFDEVLVERVAVLFGRLSK